MLRYSITFCLLVIFSLSALGYLSLPGLRDAEYQAYDWRLNLTLPHEKDKRVVILDIDEKSLKALGRWPWNRATMANLVNTLFDHYYIQTLGLDISFAEPDHSSGLQTLQALASDQLKENAEFQAFLDENSERLNYDYLFAQQLMNNDVVMGFFFRNQTDVDSSALNLGQLPQALQIKNPPTNTESFIRPTGYGANLPIFQNAAMSAGFIDNPSISEDGIIRKVPLLQYYDGQFYQSLALGMVRALYGYPPITFEYAEDNSLVGIDIEGLFIPTSRHGEVYVPYRGRFGSFTYVSAVDVLQNQVDPEILDSAIVLMGTTATGLLDMRATPVQNIFPGVEIHANVISGILDQNFRYVPLGVEEINLLQHLVIGLILMFALPRLRLLSGLLLSLGLAAFAVTINAYFWLELLAIIPIVSILLFIVLNLMLHLGYGYFVEDHNKRKMTKMFGQYVPPELVNKLSKNDATSLLEGETKELTILFSDIRGFTALSEKLEPQILTRLMNQYLTEMTKIILANQGTVDKYIGDAIMAFWGAPVEDAQHASHAVKAAAEMQQAIPKLNEKFKQEGLPEINIGIGLNTGVVNVGNMGSEFRMAYTVLGDDVNLASRLESITKQYQVNLIVSERTKEQAPDWIYQELDLVKVVGKNQPISIFHPIAKKSEINELQQKEMYLFKVAIKLYRQQKWDEARTILNDLLALTNNAFLYKLYLGRILAYQENPPGELWDGVFEAKLK